MKFLFLDIDGVLKPVNSNAFNKDNILNLNALINKTSCKIIIISDWRLKGLKTLNEIWKGLDINSEIFDLTPYYPDEGRLFEINQMIKKYDIKDYCILDDVDFYEGKTKNFVKVNPKTGLTKEDIEKALKIFGL